MGNAPFVRWQSVNSQARRRSAGNIRASPTAILAHWRTHVVSQASRLADVRYDIRGPVLRRARQLEAEGHQILKLNLGNPAPFGMVAPDAVVQQVAASVADSQGYSDARGIAPAREAVAAYYDRIGVEGVTADNVFLGNGVSELIVMSLQALLNPGDEVLVPSPDYPLWTGAVSLCGGRAVHYRCREDLGWNPATEYVRPQISDRTKAIVIINPNNPTGAVYSRETLIELLDIARRNNLLVLTDEIYDQILYDGAQHHCAAALAPDPPRSTAASTSAGCCAPAAGCTTSGTAAGSCSPRSPAWTATSRPARCTCSLASTRKYTRSSTTRRWSSTCWSSSTCCCRTAPGSTCRPPTTCWSCSRPASLSSKTRSAASRRSSPLTSSNPGLTLPLGQCRGLLT